jgi:hypothetical protein
MPARIFGIFATSWIGLTLDENGELLSINNLSGTFQCAPDCLLLVVGGIIIQRGKIEAGAISRYEV